MWKPYRHNHPEPPRLIYMGARLIAGIRLARERQVNVRVLPTIHAIKESIDLAREIFREVYKDIPERVKEKGHEN